jgi:inosine-uridine nucleoside N-ribohydrolase
MLGSIRRQYGGKEGVVAEYNVRRDIQACQKVFSVPWMRMVITPLDTCGRVSLKGERYQRLFKATDSVVQAVIENYRIWAQDKPDWDPTVGSSVLFDTVAIHQAFSSEFRVIESMGVRVTDNGYTVSDPSAPQMDVAIDWTDLDAYEEFLTDRLLANVVR